MAAIPRPPRPPLMDRESVNPCGECNVCCVHLPIAAGQLPFVPAGKKANQMCPKWDAGCTIHAERPQVCRSYFCLWLQYSMQKERFPAAWRPDNSGICISTYRSERDQSVVLNFVEVRPGVMSQQRWATEVQRMIGWFLNDLRDRADMGRISCTWTPYGGDTKPPLPIDQFIRAFAGKGLIASQG